ncbi:MAG: FHA domain-containing protein [Porticoccaceae bacterium]|jgi:predicted component of type VI protein secretion system|nr:FHA domain-containing protein [Porticoccaceae bacterium]
MKTYIVGRSDSADIQLEDSSVSGQHLSITPQSGRWHVKDLDSTNGTFVMNTQGKHEIKEETLEGSERLLLGNCVVALADLTAGIQPQSQSQLESGAGAGAGAQKDTGRQSSEDSGFSRYIRTEDGRYVRKSK